MPRAVTENDLRRPEFKDLNIDELEFRADGKIVRKDRFIVGLGDIAHLFFKSADYEISDVVARVRDLVGDDSGWDRHHFPNAEEYLDVLMRDGSILRNAKYNPDTKQFQWNGLALELEQAYMWRLAQKAVLV